MKKCFHRKNINFLFDLKHKRLVPPVRHFVDFNYLPFCKLKARKTSAFKNFTIPNSDLSYQKAGKFIFLLF